MSIQDAVSSGKQFKREVDNDSMWRYVDHDGYIRWVDGEVLTCLLRKDDMSATDWIVRDIPT